MDSCGGSGLLGVEAALAALDVITPLEAERIALADALHRVLAAAAHSQCDLPLFTQSAVDGYAVRHADLAASAALPVAGVVRAGALATTPRLDGGTTQRIFTGGFLPEGADTVVRQEWVTREVDSIRVTRTIEKGCDVRVRGEELREGAALAPIGTRVTPGVLASLAMAGVTHVDVRRAPRVCVLVTGDEIVRAGSPLQAGQVHDANGPLTASWLTASGYSQVTLRYVADGAEVVRAALEQAFDTSDLVLTTGGVSVGDHDHIPHEAGQLGARTLFWKVAQKPGKPLFTALRNSVPLLGLPGNPASVLVNLAIYVRRVLDRLEGVAEPGPRFSRGVLASAVKADVERDQWVRMALSSDEQGRTTLGRLPKQASHMLSNLPQAGALAWIPASSQDAAAGTVVRWLPLDN